MRTMTQSETTVITLLLRFQDIWKAKNKLEWSESHHDPDAWPDTTAWKQNFLQNTQ